MIPACAAMAMLLCVASPACAMKLSSSRMTAQRPDPAAKIVGCRNGWHRVGTRKDATLHRTWAVVASCEHPAWPAHLEPANRWRNMAAWVPAGSRVVVASPNAITSMQLQGKTLTPGQVGQVVMARLIDGAQVRVKLMARNRAELARVMHWRRQ